MDKNVALDFLERLADGIATTFGPQCECVIHDMDNFEHSIIHIINGHVTDRQAGDEFKVLGIQDVDRFFQGKDLVNCRGVSKDQRLLKSSTFHLQGEDFHYAFGINFDYTNLSFAETILRDLTQVGEELGVALKATPDPMAHIDAWLKEGLRRVGRPSPPLPLRERRSLIAFLEEKGSFSIQKSVPYLADRLDVSRHTIYSDLRSLKKPQEGARG